MELNGEIEELSIEGNEEMEKRIMSKIKRKKIGVVKIERSIEIEEVELGEILRRVGKKEKEELKSIEEKGLIKIKSLGNKGLGEDKIGIGM